MTDWLGEHPGGPDIILEHAGTDVTELWNSIHLPEFIQQHLTPKQCLGPLHSDEGSPPSTQGTSDPHSGDGASRADESQVQSILGAQAAESLGSDDSTGIAREDNLSSIQSRNESRLDPDLGRHLLQCSTAAKPIPRDIKL